MTPHDDQSRSARWRRLVVLILVGAVLVSGCAAGADEDDAPAAEDDGPAAGPPPTLAGGVELVATDPARVLVAEGFTFGRPLPSEQVAADAFAVEPEVRAAVARRVFALDGRLVGEALVLALEGAEIFDDGVLDGFSRGVVGALGGAPASATVLGGRAVLRSSGPERVVVGFLEGDLLTIVRGPAGPDVELVVERQAAAFAAGVVGPAQPQTPLVPLPIDAAFVAVPTLTFQPFLPPEEEPSPEAPAFPGATGLQGRYGVVAGERRTIVWAFTVDPAAYPWLEVLEPAMAALASSRASGAPAEDVELRGGVVQRANGAGGEGSRSAQVFRHEGLVLLVEGTDAAQVDAATTAWIAALR